MNAHVSDDGPSKKRRKTTECFPTTPFFGFPIQQTTDTTRTKKRKKTEANAEHAVPLTNRSNAQQEQEGLLLLLHMATLLEETEINSKIEQLKEKLTTLSGDSKAESSNTVLVSHIKETSCRK